MMAKMESPFPFENVQNSRVHMVGIKGTGMSALAELLLKNGVRVAGSDVAETFYTDQVLEALGIPYTGGFSESNLKNGTSLVIYSTAYDPDGNPELIEAQKRGIEIVPYHEALGKVSRWMGGCGIAGVHGKTTTTAMTGTLAQTLKLPVSVLVGSAVPTLQGSAVYAGGAECFIAETCEYRRHFLSFDPSMMVITSVEPDHLDYYRDMADISSAFAEYALKLSRGGTLIWCADEPGAAAVAEEVVSTRSDLVSVPYGRQAEGDFCITAVTRQPGVTEFTLQVSPVPFRLHYPGLHNVLNGTAALAVASLISGSIFGSVDRNQWLLMADALGGYRGSKRRCEIIGEAGGVLFMDDYGHHPTAIRTTLSGLKDFYPNRRIVVDFMSHTYSRTRALLDEFGTSFSQADLVILHKIYASAREQECRDVSGEDLYARVKEHHDNVLYVHEVMKSVETVENLLREGDLFLTLGAGDNWKLGKQICERRMRL